MSKANNREALLKTANLVRPALATAAYIPAMTHILFDGEFATAYNDISAIAVRLKTDAAWGCLPGDLLIRSLSSFGGESVSLQEGQEGQVLLSSGRGKIKLPVLPAKSFPYQPPEPSTKKGHVFVVIDAAMLKGIERCLLSVNNDPTHPAQMGVTLDADEDGNAVLFSTDNFTISRYQTKTGVELPGDTPVILPRFFCEQLIAISRAFPEAEIKLWMMGDGLFAEFGESAELFSKVPHELEPLDFRGIVAKHVKLSGLSKQLFDIPDAWDAAFTRALLVLSAEDDKNTRIELDGGSIKLFSTSATAEADDQMNYDADDGDPDKPFHVDPALVLRASKSCSKMGFGERVLILADADVKFVHIIAHSSAKSK